MATANWSPEARDACERSLEVKIQKIEARFPQVYNFKTSPRPYQRTGLDKAWDSEAFGFYMDMGTGKSKMAVDLFCAYFAEGRIDRLLVVTKYSTRDNWIDEFKIHAPFECDVRILDTSKAKKFDEWNTTPGDKMKVLIVATESMSAGNAPKYAQKFLSVTTRGGMVVDESHMIKTHNAIRSKNIVRIGLQAKFKVVMTGTPISQSPLDLYMQFQFLDENIIGVGDFYSFRNRYAEMGGFEKKEIIGYQNMDELMELVSPYIFQVRKSDVLTELPPKVFEVRKCTMTPTQLSLYQQVKKKRRVVDGDKGNIIQTVLEQSLRLHEIAGGVITYQREPDQYNREKFFKERIGSGKLAELIDVTRENPVSTIVWCTYREEIAMVVEALQAEYGKEAVVEIHGGVESEQRQIIVRDVFQTKKARFLVSNQAVGGTGLNMTAA
ncbi:MAG TPA: DEAD/DEAH box helicase, partial [Fimbriimonas sp.]|nr:DEAD/DEAH box helicase [Fimbriimonas sp.]